jgi:lipoprotein-anchoring transpeptidase ErfK/SrfK
MLAGPASLLILVVWLLGVSNSSAQTTLGKSTVPKRVEPGLENAVKWEWKAEASDEKNWGLPVPTPSPSPTPRALPVVPQPESRPALYEVKHGDALILIGKKFGMTVAQIKTFNGLKNDIIKVGQVLKIPTLAELSAVVPPAKHEPAKPSTSKPSPQFEVESDRLRLEIFLDREQFSAGPIVGDPGPVFSRILLLYQSTHEDAKDDPSLQAKAQRLVPDLFSHYKLKAEDFRFIVPLNADAPIAKATPVITHPRAGKPIFHPRPPAIVEVPLTYQQLLEPSMLAYRTPWGFVAERFHCQETFLHSLNEKLPAMPGIGTEFKVPNVVPFEIEKAFDEPIQPPVDPKNPVTAAVIGLAQLNIYQNGTLVAVLPLSPARPGLHGRNSWTILDTIPRPRLGTFQKVRKEQTQKPSSSSSSIVQEPAASSAPTELASAEFLPAGPRNPVGILWINLAKANSTEPLPYGLHGTSIPDRMNIEQSIGGFRLTNWDIARAVRHLPIGTPLEWK